MKKLFYILIAFIYCLQLGAESSYHVSTDIEKQKILLEEFTGINCGNCPRGHKKAHDLLLAQPHNVFVIANHSGYYSNAKSDQPNYQTEDGNAINQAFNITSYPCGSINRGVKNDNINILSTFSWIEESRKESLIDAKVNLWMSSTLDMQSRRLTVNVEGYVRESIEQDSLCVNVALTQNNIVGPQAGGGTGSNYVHQHMLRDMVTPTWGDIIHNLVPGSFFSKTYTYDLPLTINAIDVVAEELDLVCFVTKNKQSVLNVIGQRPTIIHYDKPLNAKLLPAKRPIPHRWNSKMVNCCIQSTTSQEIQSIKLQATLNSQKELIEWTGLITPFEKQEIEFELVNTVLAEQNNLKLEVLELNGQTITTEELVLDFSKPVSCGPEITVSIQTDLFADDNSFVLKKITGEVIHEFGPYENNLKKEYTEQLTLDENEDYYVEIIDKWGDGIQTPPGFIKIVDQYGNLVVQDYDIRQIGESYYFKTDATSSVEQNNVESVSVFFSEGQLHLHLMDDTFEECSIYSNVGHRVASLKLDKGRLEYALPIVLPKGIYFIRLISANKVINIQSIY